jgi:hypothetical protein
MTLRPQLLRKRYSRWWFWVSANIYSCCTSVHGYSFICRWILTSLGAKSANHWFQFSKACTIRYFSSYREPFETPQREQFRWLSSPSPPPSLEELQPSSLAAFCCAWARVELTTMSQNCMKAANFVRHIPYTSSKVWRRFKFPVQDWAAVDGFLLTPFASCCCY